MRVNYISVGFVLVLLVSSLLLFLSRIPKEGVARKLIICGRVSVLGTWLVILSAVVYLSFCFPLLGSAKDEIVYEQESPNKLCTATVFNRYGGAAVENTTDVSIRSNGEVLDTKKNSIIFREYGVHTVNVIWEGDKHLIIRSEFGEVFDQVANWKDVNITYMQGHNE